MHREGCREAYLYSISCQTECACTIQLHLLILLVLSNSVQDQSWSDEIVSPLDWERCDPFSSCNVKCLLSRDLNTGRTSRDEMSMCLNPDECHRSAHHSGPRWNMFFINWMDCHDFFYLLFFLQKTMLPWSWIDICDVKLHKLIKYRMDWWNTHLSMSLGKCDRLPPVYMYVTASCMFTVSHAAGGDHPGGHSSTLCYLL